MEPGPRPASRHAASPRRLPDSPVSRWWPFVEQPLHAVLETSSQGKPAHCCARESHEPRSKAHAAAEALWPPAWQSRDSDLENEAPATGTRHP